MKTNWDTSPTSEDNSQYRKWTYKLRAAGKEGPMPSEGITWSRDTGTKI